MELGLLALLNKVKWAVPSIITLGALISGLTAVRMAAAHRWDTACTLIFLSAFLDGLDGHSARLLGVCSPMGFQLDSLCDQANFGVAPALIMWFWSQSLPQSECRSEGCWLEDACFWIACCFHATCCCLRLARFNVAGISAHMEKQLLSDAAPRSTLPRVYTHNLMQRELYFRGLPAPFGAAYGLLPMLFRRSNLAQVFGESWCVGRMGATATLLWVGSLMVSTFPTLSSRMLRSRASDSVLRSRHPLFLALKILVLAGVVAGFKLFVYDSCLVIVFSHMLSFPLGLFVYYVLAAPKQD